MQILLLHICAFYIIICVSVCISFGSIVWEYKFVFTYTLHQWRRVENEKAIRIIHLINVTLSFLLLCYIMCRANVPVHEKSNLTTCMFSWPIVSTAYNVIYFLWLLMTLNKKFCRSYCCLYQCKLTEISFECCCFISC